MKNISTILLTLLLSLSFLQAAAFEKSAKSRTTEVIISSDKPLTTGSNTIILDITPKYKDAKVSVKAFMPAMPGMPAMESKADAKDLGNGKFETTVNLSMGGTWQLHIFITPTVGKKSRVKTSLNF
ncbi:FixH family protein [Candidatus Sulfurimonas marisnigri]|uniref:FixH family protein n=1 Tax=Candidatus Sulfurimonas marisnigri TaxID=2740405 RepID=A0A7S7RQT0_9BACT|nr:FixH family protein [Candidatus Sulfurimonas marisnigri]QOY54780.1 FixH family protein [Candidatus Sulfurimonas marisnigri]